MVAPLRSLRSTTTTRRSSPFGPVYDLKIMIGFVSALGSCFMISGVMSPACFPFRIFSRSVLAISTGRTSAPVSFSTRGVVITRTMGDFSLPAMKRSTLSAKDFSSASSCRSAISFFVDLPDRTLWAYSPAIW